MRFEVIEGGGGAAGFHSGGSLVQSRPTAADVNREAARRIAASGCETWRVRAFVTGAAMPSEIRHLQMQIEFVASALSKLAVIPDDFRSDIYWPAR